MKKRATLIVLDSVGIGALKDAKDFGDAGAHTLGHIYQKTHMAIPNMLSCAGIGSTKGLLRQMRRKNKSQGYNERALGDGRGYNGASFQNVS